MSSMNVFETRKATSGVHSSPVKELWSFTPRAASDADKPGLSSGFAVSTLMVAPMPPVGTLACAVLYTSTPETLSEAMSPKSNERPRPLCVGIWRPLSVTKLKSAPNPRTVTRAPSPRSRSIATPVIRWSASAKFVSGKSPMSSAVIASTTPVASRFVSIARLRLERIPVTTTSSIIWPLAFSPSCAMTGDAATAPRARETASETRFFANK